MKKVWIWFVLAALCAGLTACGGTPPEVIDKAPGDALEEPDAPQEEDGVTEEALLELFESATGYSGSAGASLRNAEAACKLLDFAERTNYAEVSIIRRAEAVAGAYSALSDEQREEFVNNFASIRSLIDRAFRDYTDARPVFDDAGVAEDMDAFINADGARTNWDALTSDIPSSAGR